MMQLSYEEVDAFLKYLRPLHKVFKTITHHLSG
jgi:hypothetical protein